jgi:hypothetical protein
MEQEAGISTSSAAGVNLALHAIRYGPYELPCTRKDPDRIGKLDPLFMGRADVLYEQGERPGSGALI